MSDIENKKNYVEMGRGRTQVLFNYLPGKTFDITGGILIAEVTKIIGEVAKDINNRTKLLRLIKQYTEKWNAENREDFNNFQALSETIVIEQPKSVIYDIFPLTFRCIECNRVYHYNSYSELEKNNSNLVCLFGEKCKGHKLRQLYQVAVHECGNLHGLYPITPKGCSCGKQYLILDERRSQKSSDFRWVCKKCNLETPLEYFCKECDSQNRKMTVTPHRASKCYFPHYVRCVDVPEASSSEQIKTAIRSYLNISEESSGSQYEVLLQNLIEKLGSAEAACSILENSGIKPPNSSQLNIESLSELPVGDVVYEYINTISNKNITVCSLNERAEKIKPFNPHKALIMQENDRLFKEIGISSVKLIEDFPVISAVFAWSRIDLAPSQGSTSTHLKSFKFGSDEPGKTPVYVDSGKCEALMFEVDPLNVVSWLRVNGIDVTLASENVDHAKHWILKNVRHLNTFEETDKNDQQDKATWFVSNLIHSMSHIAMKSIAGISGFEIQGLSEYIFPETLSFIIYSNKTDFIIGGMHTLFEEQAELLRNRMLSRDMSICMHDPLCSERNSACHACLFLPEIACSKFNKNLNRSVLYGYKNIHGFFEGRIL